MVFSPLETGYRCGILYRLLVLCTIIGPLQLCELTLFMTELFCRHDYMDHIQASLATLLFPPTHRAWPENFSSYRDRLRGVCTKQFIVVTVFQFVETLSLLALWTFLEEEHIPMVPTLIVVISWSVARIVCHIGYYVFILLPFYIFEGDNCTRRRGKYCFILCKTNLKC